MCSIFAHPLVTAIIGSVIGTLVGVIGGFYIAVDTQKRKERSSVKERLISHLMALCDFEFATIEGEERESRVSAYHRTFNDIYTLIYVYRDMISDDIRGRLDNAWGKYKGTENKKEFKSFYVQPSNEGQVQERIKALLEALK